MSVDRAEVLRIAALARLGLGDEEVDRLTRELNSILEHVDALESLELVELSDLAPQVREPLPSTRSEGADSPDPLLHPREEVAPEMRDGFFVVPPPPGLDGGNGS